MSVITRLRKARPYLTAPWNPDEEGESMRGLSPDRMSGVASSPQVDQPISSRPYQPDSPMLDTPKMPDLSATDYYQSNRSVRPRMDATIQDPQARLSDYESNLINYQPQKESAGKIIGRAALGFISGGIPGAAYTAGSDLLDRKALDRNWQQGEIGRTEGMIGRLNTQKRAGLQDKLIQSQIGENEAQTIQRLRKPAPETVSYGGYNISPNEAARLAQEKDLAANKPAPVRQPILRERLNPDGTKSTLRSDDNGQTWNEVKDLGSAAPPQPEVPDVSAQNAPDIKTINDRLQTNLKELRQHENEIATKNAAIKKQGEADYQEGLRQYNAALANGEKPAKPQRKDFYERAQNNDPDYLDGTVEKVKNRIAELKTSNTTDQRDLEGLQRESRKAIQKPRKVSSNVFKPASDGKYHYTEAQIRANLNGKTYEETVAHLKSLPNVVIDQ